MKKAQMMIEKPKDQKFKGVKKLLRSLSLSKGRQELLPPSPVGNFLPKSKSCSEAKRNTKRKLTPGGCFPVYVGPEKQRFVIKTEYSDHPLFKMLLEDAELEYGFNSNGPILLPCDVDLFYKVLAEMDCKNDIESRIGFRHGSCSPFTNSTKRMGKSMMPNDYAPYNLLTPSRLLRINR